jgi:N-acetylneuraminic acid mutarotase
MSSVLQRGLTIAATALILAVPSRTAVSQSSWTKAGVFPEPEEELYGVTANGKMYVIGGYGLGSPRGFVYEYDPAADKWTKKKPMARAAHHSALVEYRGKIYVFGGFVPPPSGPPRTTWVPIDNAWEYDPAADSWKALPPIPTRRGAAIAFEVGGKLYVIGGASVHPGSKDLGITPGATGRAVATNEVYDPATNKWEARQTMPTARNHAYGGVVGGKIYVIGGRMGAAGIGAATNSDIVEVYDPAVDSWGGAGARMPTPRSGGAWGTYAGRIYVAGGEVSTPVLVGAYRAIEVYDPASNQWNFFSSMPSPRHGVAGAVLGNRFHLVSGMVSSSAASGADPDIHLHTNAHDVIELPGQAVAAR